MRKVLWAEPALSDLDAIHAYISRDSIIYADAVILEILESVDRLLKFPDSGRIVPELGDQETREIIVGNYRVMYDVGQQEIEIVTLLHGARDFPQHQ